jgi:putative ABC transport system ATP-binding protein
MNREVPLLETHHARRRATGSGNWLLQNIALTLGGGERVAIVGPSGSGKTLLLRALAMLDPLDAGSVRWRGEVPTGAAVPAYRRCVLYLHQRPALVDGTVEDNLRRPFQLRQHRNKRYDRDQALTLLDALGRDAGFLRKRHHELSGGETQLVALVRALQLDPQVLLLDEPTAALDGGTTVRVERCLCDWLDQQPTTRAQCWITHDISQANRVATRILHMAGGQLVNDTRQ